MIHVLVHTIEVDNISHAHGIILSDVTRVIRHIMLGARNDDSVVGQHVTELCHHAVLRPYLDPLRARANRLRRDLDEPEWVDTHLHPGRYLHRADAIVLCEGEVEEGEWNAVHVERAYLPHTGVAQGNGARLVVLIMLCKNRYRLRRIFIYNNNRIYDRSC